MKTIKNRTLLLISSLFLALCLSGCGDSNEKKPVDEAEKPSQAEQASSIVAAHTSGIVSRTDAIRVLFDRDVVSENEIGKPLEKSPFMLVPGVEGEAMWSSSDTLEFIPAKELAAGTSYAVILKTEQLPELPNDQKDFPFSFQTLKRDFQIKLSELEYVNEEKLDELRISGSITSSDKEKEEDVEKFIVAEQKKTPLKVEWKHSGNRRSHDFIITGIKRGSKKSSVSVHWNAEEKQSGFKGQRAFFIAPLGDFNILKAKFEDEEEQRFSISFSDPLDKKQNLKGLIHIPRNSAGLKFVIEQNSILVFPSSRLTGDLELHIEPGIKNIFNKPIQKKFVRGFKIKDIKPQIKLLGKGTIIPNSTKTIFPFDAVNLNAVDLIIKRISERNVHQFLQVNNMKGNYQMRRVGETVFKKKVSLTGGDGVNLNGWNRHGIDLSSFITAEPGAIYQVTIAFRKGYSLYGCKDSATSSAERGEISDTSPEEEASAWDIYEQYNYYDYRKRNDPCSSAYYLSRNHFKDRNVFATDIGLIVKKATDETLTIAVTNLLTAEPVTNAELEIYNFTKKLLKKISTGENGIATVPLDQKPFLVVAKKGTQRGYLPLKDGRSRSLSKFDVSGTAYKKGLKGYLYGERGVWRPGDEMHLTFILEDPEETLPKEHPVFFELSNPKGQVVKRIVTKESLNGFYSFPVKTDEKTLTGDYTATVKAGGAVFTKTLKVETILPNRLKIAFDIGKEFISKGDKSLKGKFGVTWLHGAVAKELKAKVDVTLVPTKTQFPKFADFVFDDQGRHFRQESFPLFDSKVDKKGMAVIPLKIPVTKSSPGMLSVTFTARVFEPGGNFSTDRFSIPFHPYQHYVGLKLPQGDKRRGMLLTDKDHSVDIVTVNQMGEPVSRKDISVSLYKLSWKWWWEQTSGSKVDYASKKLTSPIATGKIETKDGVGTWNVRVNSPDWGRYLVRACDKEGHCSGKVVYIDWPGYAGRDQGKQAGVGTTIIAFTAEKKSYKVGETIKVSIPSGNKGRALVNIETGSKVLQSHWVETQKGETPFSFTADTTMLPNIYVSVTMLQPHGQTANDLPIRLYGLLPLTIIDPDTRLSPKIEMDDVLRPEEEVLINVREESGRPMTYTIALVDDGLLDLTRFKTPDPWNSFFAKEALSTKTWDYFDEVLGVYGDAMKTLLSIGGGDEVSQPKDSKANRFKPVVKFLGPFHLEADGTGQHIIEMPSYVGSVRTMVVAGNREAYGSTEKTTPVRKPLMVIGTLPRVAGVGETINFPLTIFALEKNIKDVTVELITNDLLTVGETLKSVTFTETGDKVVNFPIKVGDGIGTATLRAIASSGDEISEYHVDLTVRNPNPPRTVVSSSSIEPQKEEVIAINPIGILGTNSGVLEVSSMPPMNLAKRLDYLIRYPHGCIEQTTSAAFPQLYLNDLLELDESRKGEIEKNVNFALKRLVSFQLPSGGFTSWPGQEKANEWASNYAGSFALEASRLGYLVPKGLLPKFMKHQREMAANWIKTNEESELVQAYRLYVLALANQPMLGAMNRFRESRPENVPAQWTLAASYYLVGQKEVALEMTKGLPMSVKKYTELSNTYGSATRDKALILEAMTLMGLHGRTQPLIEDISKTLNSNEWLNTQATAFSLLALGKTVRANGGELAFNYRHDGGDWITVSRKKPMVQIPLDLQDAKPREVTLLNTSATPLFSSLQLRGTPANSEEQEISSNLDMRVTFFDMQNKEISPAEILQGTDFSVSVSVRNPSKQRYDELALTQVFPSGWEIINSRMSGIKPRFTPTYQDIRDDRVMTYFNLKPKEEKTFNIYLNASYKGRFYLPGQIAGAMYDNSIKALNKGQWVEVVETITKNEEQIKQSPDTTVMQPQP